MAVRLRLLRRILALLLIGAVMAQVTVLAGMGLGAPPPPFALQARQWKLTSAWLAWGTAPTLGSTVGTATCVPDDPDYFHKLAGDAMDSRVLAAEQTATQAFVHRWLSRQRDNGAVQHPPPTWLMPKDQSANSLLVLRYGLPLRSHTVRYETHTLHDKWQAEPQPPQTLRVWQPRAWPRTAAAAPYDGLLPLVPQWWPFAANVAFWAALAAALVIGLRAARRWRRARHGLCRQCGYSLKGLGESQHCPECGASSR